MLPVDDWSWHLWFCEEAPGVHNYPAGSGVAKPVLMDRNLGAGPATQIGLDGIVTTDLHPVAGLYYKWGNKNPGFLSGASVTYKGTGGDGTGWGADKTINDPCPPGYKVPSSEVWMNPDEWTQEITIFDGSFLYYQDFIQTDGYDTEIEIRYPYSSYIDGTSLVEFKPISDGPNNTEPITNTGSGVFQYSFTLTYAGTYEYKIARLFAEDKAIECEYKYYEVNPESLKYTGSFKLSALGYTFEKSVNNLTQQQLKNYQLKITTKLFGREITIIDTTLEKAASSIGISIDDLCQTLFSTIKNNMSHSLHLKKLQYGTKQNEVSTSHGLQVRCVVD